MLNQDQETKAVKKTMNQENNQKYLRQCCNEYKAATEICDHSSSGDRRSYKLKTKGSTPFPTTKIL